MKVNPGNSDLVATYQGYSYYFCAEGCRNAFEANAKKYLERKPTKSKGWWGRYLERMGVANRELFGGGPPQCH
jgi:YHS domain-containing protein